MSPPVGYVYSYGEKTPFLLEFSCSGPRVPATDEDGEEIWTLWKIYNKYKFKVGGETHYDVQYWENWHGSNVVHARPASEVEASYPEQVAEWEREFGGAWTAKYPRGNFFTPKRGFESTPSKPKSKEKKSRVADLADEDVEMVDPDPILSRQNRRAPLARTRSVSREVEMAPPPRPQTGGVMEPVRSRAGASRSHPETPSASIMAMGDLFRL